MFDGDDALDEWHAMHSARPQTIVGRYPVSCAVALLIALGGLGWNGVNAFRARPDEMGAEARQCEFVASGRSDAGKYHRSECRWAKKITSQNLLGWSSSVEAELAGRLPCKVCCKAEAAAIAAEMREKQRRERGF